jgi:ParB-like chromosome segregation protein Spo0J
MLESLKGAIRTHGFLEPLVVQRRSETFGPMVLIGGHQRLKAVREICIEDNRPQPDLPCIVIDVPDRTAKMLNVSLNNIAGEFDPKLLGELLEDVNRIHTIDLDEIQRMGFDEEDVSKYLHLADPPQIDNEPQVFAHSATLSLEFKDIRQRDAVKAKLLERAKLTKRTTGEVVDGLLGGGRRKR